VGSKQRFEERWNHTMVDFFHTDIH
jgi:hypothetical protein